MCYVCSSMSTNSGQWVHENNDDVVDGDVDDDVDGDANDDDMDGSYYTGQALITRVQTRRQAPRLHWLESLCKRAFDSSSTSLL